jgi:hypothetical protein
VPSAALGVNGDFYLDTATGIVYKKAGGAWAPEDNLTGPPGPAGAAAAGGVSFTRLRGYNETTDPTKRFRVLTDLATLVDATGAGKAFGAVDVMADLAAAGANGLDTGAVAANTTYDYWLIGKADGTVAGLFSKSLQWTVDQLYADANRDAVMGLRDAAARTFVGQGFKVAAAAKLHSIDVSLMRIGVPVGYLWAEIQADAAGLPSGAALARGVSLTVPVDTFDTVNRVRFRFVFPERPALVAGTQYHVVLKGDWPVSAANYMTVGVDASAPTYAGGTFSVWSGAAWTADATRDLALFVVNTLTGAENPTLPPGYTYAGRCSCLLTDATGNLFRVRQIEERVLFTGMIPATLSIAGANQWAPTELQTVLPTGWLTSLLFGLASAVAAHYAAMADQLPWANPNLAANTYTLGRFHGSSPGSFNEIPVEIAAWPGPIIWTSGNTANVIVVIRGYRLGV